MRIAAGALLFALAAVDISFSDAIHAGNSGSLLASTSRLPLRHPGWISDIRGGSTGKLLYRIFLSANPDSFYSFVAQHQLLYYPLLNNTDIYSCCRRRGRRTTKAKEKILQKEKEKVKSSSH